MWYQMKVVRKAKHSAFAEPEDKAKPDQRRLRSAEEGVKMLIWDVEDFRVEGQLSSTPPHS